tara:strand:+ start:243 stop:554 length:312 start_codon:yes stop_codon:yes gene_type:complete
MHSIKNVSGYTENIWIAHIYRGADGLWYVFELCNRIRFFGRDSLCHGDVFRVQRTSDHASYHVSVPHGVFLTAIRPLQLASILPKNTSSPNSNAKYATFVKTG